GFREFTRIVDNHERYALFLGGRFVSCLKVGKQNNEVIQSGPQIVDAIARDERPPNQIGGRTDLAQTNSHTASVVATLEKSFITVSLYPLLDFSIERFEMFFSAGQFGEHA